MHEVLVNRLGGLSLPRKNPDMTLDVTMDVKQQHNNNWWCQVLWFSFLCDIWLTGFYGLVPQRKWLANFKSVYMYHFSSYTFSYFANGSQLCNDKIL